MCSEKGGDIEDLMKKSTPKAATAKAKASGTRPGVEKEDVSESKSFLQEHALLLCVLGGLTAFALARRLSAA